MEERKARSKKITIIFKVLELFTYKQIGKPYSDFQKCRCRDKVLQPLKEQKIGKTLF